MLHKKISAMVAFTEGVENRKISLGEQHLNILDENRMNMESWRVTDSQIKRGKGRPMKTIRETIRNDLKVNDLIRNKIYDKTLWRNFIYVVNPT